MKKVMVVFGTRPEAIKMAPVIIELNNNPNFSVVVCVTGQHKEMLNQVLEVFDIIPDYDLKIMTERQTLSDITSKILMKISNIIDLEKPDIILVHGDTSSTFSAALAAFYKQVKIAHVEAGLRTHNIYSPYPEEFNRKTVGQIADLHFAPTEQSRNNLLIEGINNSQIFITGNTAIDALVTTINNKFSDNILENLGNSRIILLTAHRRENLGKPMENIFRAVNSIVNEYEDVTVIFPIHKNPLIRELSTRIFGNNSKVKIIEPLDVIKFHNYMNAAYLILTDSGGIQEEAPSLGKPVLVLRETTERPEGVEAGTLKLVGTSESVIYENVKNLLDNFDEYSKMALASNPYGDGNASRKIVQIVSNYFNEENR